MLVLFRCTTFIGVCVEMVAAVTWLAELFETSGRGNWPSAGRWRVASLGGILVTEVYNAIVRTAADPGSLRDLPFPAGHDPNNIAWRLTLLTGLIPGADSPADAVRTGIESLGGTPPRRHVARPASANSSPPTCE